MEINLLMNRSEYSLATAIDSYESSIETCRNLLKYYTNCNWQREMGEYTRSIAYYENEIVKIEIECKRRNITL